MKDTLIGPNVFLAVNHGNIASFNSLINSSQQLKILEELTDDRGQFNIKYSKIYHLFRELHFMMAKRC